MEELLQAIRANPAGTGPTITARALGVARTSMFDAWAAYDARAFGLFFTLGNALMDASIAAWCWRYKYDFVRPITGIREHYRFEGGDLHGRSLGAAVGGDAWVKAQSYVRPFSTGPL